MPFALPLAATAAAAAAPAAAAASASAGLTATLVSVASQAAVSMAINAAMSLLSPKVGAGGRPVDWTLDPNGPIPFAFGRVGVAGAVIHKRTFGPDKMNYGLVSVLSGAGPIDGFESYTADDLQVTFDANGRCTTPEWAGEMFRASRLGNQPDTFMPTPIGLKNNSTLPNWTGQHRASGKALSMVVMVENSKGTAFPNGEIKPREVLRGLRCWDPRRDSTYPGGLGPCRLDDPSTWVWLENPAIFALKWALGLWESATGKGAPHVGQQVGGIGSRLSGIDVPAFVAAANVADANGWTCAAYPNTGDDKHQVLVSFLQAAGAIYSQRAGKISCIQRAAPRASVVTLTADDVVGPIELDTAASRIDRINTIQPSYWSPQHRWQITALPEVTAQAYRDLDGQKRSRGVTYPYVTNASQAAQLAALDIANSRESMAGQVALKPQHQRIQPGDAFTISEPGFLMDGLKFLCMRTEYDPAEAVVRVTFISETDAKYPFALGQSTVPPAPPTLTAFEPVSPPLPEDWVIVPRPPAQDGTQIPGFDLEGIVSNDMATAVIVEWGPTANGPWTQAYSGPPTVTRIPIVGLQSAETYFIAVQYQVASRFSERMVYGPYVAPTLSAGIDQGALDQIREDFDGLLGPIRDDIVAEAGARQSAILQEARDRAAALLAEAVARGEAIAEVQTKIDTVKTDLSTEVSTRQTAISAVQGSVAAAEQAAKTYADGKIATATQNFTTTATLNSALSSTLSSANSYSDGIKTYADQTFATVSSVNGSLAQTLIDAKSYADGKIADSRLTLATKAELATAKSDTLISAKSYTDALRTDANQTFATQSSLNGVDSKATIAQNTAVAADGRARALIGLETQVGGLVTGIYSGNDGRIGSVRVSAHQFSIETPGNPADRLEFTGTTGLKLFKNNVRRIHVGFV